MNKLSRKQILDNASIFFVDFFNQKSKSYTRKKPETFKINPFTIQATAKAISDSVDSESIAKAIVYPFALGTSIATSFGTKVQEFIVTTMGDQVNGSIVSGMDIEYVDAIDGRKKYCQLKSGPTTINHEDIETIENHFKDLSNLARTNKLEVNTNDRVSGVLYDDHRDLSEMYKKIEKDGFVVLSGEDFWYHLTGYKGIYTELIQVAQQAAATSEMKDNIQELITRVQDYIEQNPKLYGLN